MHRKHLNIGGKIQARCKAISQEDLAQLCMGYRASPSPMETGTVRPDLDRLVEAGRCSCEPRFPLREPQQQVCSSSPSSLAVGGFPSFAEDCARRTRPVFPEGSILLLNGMGPAVAVSASLPVDGSPVAHSKRSRWPLVSRNPSAPLSGFRTFFGLPETPLNPSYEPTSLYCLARSDDSDFMVPIWPLPGRRQRYVVSCCS